MTNIAYNEQVPVSAIFRSKRDRKVDQNEVSNSKSAMICSFEFPKLNP